MIVCSPEKAIKNIFERSVKSLNDSRDQLYRTRKILKKAIVRLSTTSYSDDEQLNEIINDIKTSTDKNINLDELDSKLDQLSILVIKKDTGQSVTIETEFYSSLKRSLDESNCSDSCKAIVNSLVKKKLSDKDISLELVKLINDATANKL